MANNLILKNPFSCRVLRSLLCWCCWLSRYRYGPLEWAWRCGTYFKGMPFKVERRAGNGE
ncbi:DUF418 domain-containing protein [Gilvimarinus gilvus]|uniref:DUF418 domain-containing protein n=1 Tax=Gilvimarinus gilvus TaxID=3058038 RepID=UPI0034A031B7